MNLDLMVNLVYFLYLVAFLKGNQMEHMIIIGLIAFMEHMNRDRCFSGCLVFRE
jgi:hypothetical protein